MFLLDTDHLTILERRNSNAPAYAALIGRMSAFAPTDFFVSIVSFHEQSLGWNAYIQAAGTTNEVSFGYERFLELLDVFATLQVLPFDVDAARVFDSLRSHRIRVATMDLRIASIALDRGFTLLSRNAVDFNRIPGLHVEDWTQ